MDYKETNEQKRPAVYQYQSNPSNSLELGTI